MPWLLVPLIFLILLALWLVLLPLSLWRRYRLGKARRRVRPGWMRFNAWALLVSTAAFLGLAVLMQGWFPHQLAHAGAGLAVGLMLGGIGVALSRFDDGPQGLCYTPHPWPVLALTLLVAGRVVLSLVQAARQGVALLDGGRADAAWHAGLIAVGGVLLGYSLAYAWGLRWRVRCR